MLVISFPSSLCPHFNFFCDLSLVKWEVVLREELGFWGFRQVLIDEFNYVFIVARVFDGRFIGFLLHSIHHIFVTFQLLRLLCIVFLVVLLGFFFIQFITCIVVVGHMHSFCGRFLIFFFIQFITFQFLLRLQCVVFGEMEVVLTAELR